LKPHNYLRPRGGVPPLPKSWALKAMLPVVAALLLASPATGVEQFPSGPKFRGTVKFEQYAVFPENRPGNGVYLNSILLYSVDGQTIQDVLPLTLEGRFVFLADNGQEQTLGVRVVEELDKPPRIKPVGKGLFHVVLVLDGVVYKKLYRVIESKIYDLLPSSKTADGAEAGLNGVTFYHITSAEKEETESGSRSIFGMKLHVVLYEDERVHSLGHNIRNTLPSLDLKWVDEKTISYKLADGTIEELSLAQFQ